MLLTLRRTTHVCAACRARYGKRSLATSTSRDLSHKFSGTSFRDHAVVVAEAGRGGDGCVSFLREKFLPKGPPNGGSGGHGGNVYVAAVAGLTSLDVGYRARSGVGMHGRGSNMNGRKGDDLLIKVPVGTVVQEVELSEGERRSEEPAYDKPKRGLWVHYPRSEDDNHAGDRLKEAERILRRQYRALLPRGSPNPFYTPKVKPEAALLRLDLDEVTPIDEPVLLCRGGVGGFGNSFFLTTDNRSPKFASRGLDGQRRKFVLELKTIADIGLVGAPNAGKSTLLRALSNARPKTADYAFTTLAPHLGTVSYAAVPASGAGAGQDTMPGVKVGRKLGEERSFTVADIPGLIEGANDDRGLGHDFLRHVERARVLCIVLDLSATTSTVSRSQEMGDGDRGVLDPRGEVTGIDPARVYRLLRKELALHSPGLERRRTMVVANKADLPSARGQLAALLETIAACALEDTRITDPDASEPTTIPPVVIMSAKDKIGVDDCLRVMAKLVEKERETTAASGAALEERPYSAV
ncbi:GTPase of the mitochondrial inner membrane that associates with the large ribosomal subunit [Savitreella phatthalungensis]